MKTDLTTRYLGLTLKNPLIAASSGMTGSLDNVELLADAGVSAVVLKSIFEEQILREIDSLGVNNMYGSFAETENYVSFYTKKHNLNTYIELIKQSKERVDIPIIASISCLSDSGWEEYAAHIEEAGADALELNMFIMPSDPSKTGIELEQTYFDIIAKILATTKLPVALKVGTYFSGMAEMMVRLSATGIAGLVLFNRFFSPDINIEEEKIVSGNVYSQPVENGNILRWLSILSGKVSCPLVGTTGIHDGETVIKNMLAGASAVQLATSLYKQGCEVVPSMLKTLEEWMAKKDYTSTSQFIGKLGTGMLKHPMIVERGQFMKYFSNHY